MRGGEHCIVNTVRTLVIDYFDGDDDDDGYDNVSDRCLRKMTEREMIVFHR